MDVIWIPSPELFTTCRLLSEQMVTIARMPLVEQKDDPPPLQVSMEPVPPLGQRFP